MMEKLEELEKSLKEALAQRNWTEAVRIMTAIEFAEEHMGIENPWRAPGYMQRLKYIYMKEGREAAVHEARRVERELGLKGLAEDVANWPVLRR